MAYCPHCGQPGIFPNVHAAADPSESHALDARHAAAYAAAAASGSSAVLADFERAAAASLPVRNVGELELRILCSPTAMTSTFEKMQNADSIAKGDDPWTPLRLAAGAALFPNYQQEIRFGAVALGPDPIGVENYGPFTLVLKEAMVEKRCTVFETNTARVARDEGIARGGVLKARRHRATWMHRGRLAAAKLGSQITSVTTPAAFAGVLLQPGPTSQDDEFVEPHVYRPITIRAVARVIVRKAPPPGTRRQSRAILTSVRTALRKAGIALEEI